MLHGIALQVSLDCPRCHQPVHLQGLGEAVVCDACTSSIALPAERWREWFGPSELAEALGFANGEARRVASLGGDSAKYAYGHRMPRCQECETDVPAEELAMLASAGSWSCPCGEAIRVRRPTPVAAQLLPGVRWLVNEGATGSDNAEPRGASAPIMFACMACGGGLQVDGSSRTVACEYCGGSNYLPDGLWLRLHPQGTVRTFFAVLEVSDLDLLSLKARSDEEDVRCRVAADPRLRIADFEHLAQDDRSQVRLKLASNRQLPPSLVDVLIQDDHHRVREHLARNPVATPETLTRLVEDRDSDVRRAAVCSGRVPGDALLRLAKREEDRGVLKAIVQQPITPALLVALGDKRRGEVLSFVAGHPETPATTLEKLAQAADSSVLSALARRPIDGPGTPLPKTALLALAAHDHPEVTKWLRTRPDYRKLTAQQRIRWFAIILMIFAAGAIARLTGLLPAP